MSILSQIIAYAPNKIDTETKARSLIQGPRLMDQGGRIGFKRGNITTHPVKPLTKDQQKIYDMMLNKELPTNRPSVANRLVERFNKPWEQLDNTARANFINQTYPRYKKLLERSEGKISRNQLAKILSEKLDRPISLGQIHGYGSNRLGQRQKTAFGKKLDEILNVKNVTPKNPMYKIPTDADIEKLKPLLDITPANSLKNSTADNIVKLNKKYSGMYKNGKLPSLETVLKDFPNMTSTQASNATIRLSQIYSGNKFKLFSNLDPKIKKAVENIKVDKKLGNKVFKLIGDSKFNDYRNAMYRISLGMIDEKLGNSKGTFEALKLKARNILKENKIPVYSPEKKNAAGKVIQKAQKGFNINEIAGVSGSAKSKAAEFSQFIDVMEGNLNQKTMANFQSKLSTAREIIEKDPSKLSSESKRINKLAKNLENTYNVKLPRLKDPDATKYFSPKRLKELQDQGLDIVKAAERAGYTVQMPKNVQTIQEFVKSPKNLPTKSSGMKLSSNPFFDPSLMGKVISDLGKGVNVGLGPTGMIALTKYLEPEGGYDLSRTGDRLGFEVEAALAKPLVSGAVGVTDKIKNPMLRKVAERAALAGMSPAMAMRLARIASPVGIASLAGEGIYKLGKLGYEDQQRFNALSPEEQAAERAEQEKFAFDIEGA